MSKVKDLNKFSAQQMQEFLMSFDIIMSDIDGVIWAINKPVEGALESLMTLRKLGKQVYLVTNNNTNTIEHFYEKIRGAYLGISQDHIINTTKVIIWYLKKIDFRGEVFAIVSDAARDALKEAGIQLTEEPKVFTTDVVATLNETFDRPSVKAVIADFDVNFNWAKTALAISCLKRKDVLYIAGALDDWLHISTTKQSKVEILGPGPLVRIITTQSERKPILCGKPSQTLKDYIFDTCKVTDLQRCLFIGDTINQDMKFATMCGFMKLLVGTGLDTLEKAQKEDDACPDYYISSLGQLFSTYKTQHTANYEDS